MLRQYASINILIVLFVALAIVYSVIVPLGEGPDEPGHAAYVFFLAREGRLPLQRVDSQQSDVPGEGHQPPLAYALAAPLVAWLPLDQRMIDLPGNARFTWSGGAEVNAVAHGSREYLPWSGAVLAWHLARLMSVALGAVAVLCTYGAALALSPASRATALLAALLVALNPQFLFITSLVTNDALLVALSALLLWLIVDPGCRATVRQSPRLSLAGRLLQQPTTRPIAIGVVLGLALLTKQSALILAPIALVAVAARGYAGRRAAGVDAASRCVPGLRAVVLPCLLVLAGASLVAGWWYARNLRLYGDLFGLAAFRAEFVTQPFEIGNPAAWRDALAQLHDSFWARFGWMNVPAPVWVIGAIAIIELLGVVGLLGALADHRRTTNDRPQTTDHRRPTNDHRTSEEKGARNEGRGATFARSWGHNTSCAYVGRQSSVVGGRGRPGGRWALAALPILAFAWVVSFAVTAGLVAWQGRLMFPALPAIAILLARGLAGGANEEPAAARPFARRQAAVLLSGLLLAAIALWIPFGVIRPAYPFHTLPEETALARSGTRVYGRFKRPGEQGAELRGWRLEGSTRAGGALELVLIWHARARQNRDWVVFIHLVDKRDQIVAEDNRPPQDGAFPMTQWVAGDWVEDRHPLLLPPTITPGTYTVRVGLYDPATHRRTGVYNQRGDLRGDYLEIGSIAVTSE